MVRTVLMMVFVVAVSSCKKGPLDGPVPTEPIAFRKFLLDVMPTAMEKTECQCCKKPLAECFLETIHKDAGACPYS